MKTKIGIKSILGKVLFEYEKENNTIKETLEEAVNCGANLHGANLHGADLHGADLHGANLCVADLHGADLHGANLHGADLCSADLHGADLHGADLHGANLHVANLYGAYLRGADLYGADLSGANFEGANLGDFGKLRNYSDILIVGNIGSRNGYTTIFHTNKGVFVQCGCFKGTIEEFEKKVKETHQGNNHERDYLAMIRFAKIKFGMNEENKTE